MAASPSASPEILSLVDASPVEMATALPAMHAADLAAALNALPIAIAAHTIAALPFDVAVRVFDVPALHHPERLIERLNDRFAAPLLEAISPNRRAEVFRGIPAHERRRLLETLRPETREQLAVLLRYPPDVAGGIMTTEIATVAASSTVDEALARVAGWTGHAIHAVYVTDGAGALVHVASVADLVRAPLSHPVTGAGEHRAPIAVSPLTPRALVAQTMAKYDLVAIPVVDGERHLVGVVAIDDVIDLMVADQTADAQRFGGVTPLVEPYRDASVGAVLRHRLWWLSVVVMFAALSVVALLAIDLPVGRRLAFAACLLLVLALAALSGMQSSALTGRAIANGEIGGLDGWRILGRELVVGLAGGIAVGAVAAALLLVTHVITRFDPGVSIALLAITIATSLVAAVAAGALGGAALAFLVRRMGRHPSAASAPLVGICAAAVGLVLYAVVATVTLRGAH